MKILYHHRIASKDGQYVHVEAIITSLKTLGHEVLIVAPTVSEQSEFGSSGQWVSSLKKSLPKALYELLEFSYSFYDLLLLCIAILKHRPDCIYERSNLFLPSGIWAKKLFRLPLQLEVNSPLYIERKKYGGIALDGLARWSERYTWKNADQVLPVTHVIADYLQAEGVSKEKITVIPNGVDTDVFQPKNPTNRKPEFKNKLVIGFVGFCREWHKLDEIITLLAREQRTDLALLIVGDGPVINQLRDQAKSLGFENNFFSTGFVSREEMPLWLDQIDIALQTAVTPWASPLKLIEYLAKGHAIVAPNATNIRELLTDGRNALLFKEDDFTDMLKMIDRFINDDELRVRLQQGALATIQEKALTWSNNGQIIADTFKNIIVNQTTTQTAGK